MLRRLPSHLIRHLFAEWRAGRLSASALALELGLGRTRIYELRTEYLRACALGGAHAWQPSASRGDHQSDWPPEALALATRLLSSSPRSSYIAVAASCCAASLSRPTRASVRRWAKAHHLAPGTRYKKPASSSGDDGKAPVRTLRLSVDAPPRSRLIHCLLPDGDIFLLKSPPSKNSLPLVLLHPPIF